MSWTRQDIRNEVVDVTALSTALCNSPVNSSVTALSTALSTALLSESTVMLSIGRQHRHDPGVAGSRDAAWKYVVATTGSRDAS